jgi:hypothetical protein
MASPATYGYSGRCGDYGAAYPTTYVIAAAAEVGADCSAWGLAYFDGLDIPLAALKTPGHYIQGRGAVFQLGEFTAANWNTTPVRPSAASRKSNKASQLP